ncbi:MULTISPECIES: ABC transporter permease [unclassified Carboxylicivirga]|uniref:ABC transporter permease n=1 Tax=Carboxylicivirga TaxID=1628153 RepID=UPI003D327CAF
MDSNYLSASLRFFKRNRLFTGINILGLSIALSVSFLILLYVINAYSYNRIFENKNRIYRVLNYHEAFEFQGAATPFVLADYLRNDFTQFESIARTRTIRNFKLQKHGEWVDINRAVGSESAIFSIFSIGVAGSVEQVLADKQAIVISEQLASRFFPGEDPLGKLLKSKINGEQVAFQVKAVFEDLPENSTFKADCFVSSQWALNELNKAFGVNNAHEDWSFDFWNTWCLLHEHGDTLAVNRSFKELEAKVFSDENRSNFSLQHLTDIYLNSPHVTNNGIEGNAATIRIFLAIGMLVIIVAAFNYIILSTAIFSNRAKEIGVRKANGASQHAIRHQLLLESVTLSFMVLPMAMLFALVGKPYAEQLFSSNLSIIPGNVIYYCLLYFLLVLAIGLASGLYTAAYLSGLEPLKVLNRSVKTGSKKYTLQMVLLLVQLVIFCVLITGAIVIRAQYQFALNKNLGYSTDQLLQIHLGRDFDKYEVFMQSIRSMPEVLSAGGSMHPLPTQRVSSYLWEHTKNKNKKIKMESLAVDYDFIETMGLTMNQGRSFSRAFAQDKKGMILNETAVRELGMERPIGYEHECYTVIGVVKDFDFYSIHKEIPPLSLEMFDNYYFYATVKYLPGSLNKLIPSIKGLWNELSPDRPLDWRTNDEYLEQVYSEENNLSTIVSVAALLAMLIAVMGLVGLTIFITQAQTKDIGVKKVFGCSNRSVITMNFRKYLLLTIVSLFISIPIVMHVMGQWLEGFVYKIEFQWWMFGLSGLIASVITLAAISWQSWRAATRNPVEALRYE